MVIMTLSLHLVASLPITPWYEAACLYLRLRVSVIIIYPYLYTWVADQNTGHTLSCLLTDSAK